MCPYANGNPEGSNQEHRSGQSGDQDLEEVTETNSQVANQEQSIPEMGTSKQIWMQGSAWCVRGTAGGQQG